ncbi:hypothetical protein ACHAPU_011500 [Fusarium lateritium]
MAVCTTLVTASPARPNFARGDPLLGAATCPTGVEFGLNAEESAAGAEGFRQWVEQGADGNIDLSDNFKGQISKTRDGVTFFACDYKSGGRGTYINGNLVQSVLPKDGYLDRKCGSSRAGYERSNDLTIGRTFLSPLSIESLSAHMVANKIVP